MVALGGRRAVLGLALLLTAPGCTSPAELDPDAAQVTTTGGCDTPAGAALEPVEVPADGGTVTALPFADLPVREGEELKVVWRVTGQGELQVTPVRPDGSEAALAFGPRAHGSSSFPAPGDEWGTGVLLDAPGCWELRVTRGDLGATLPVPVLPAGDGG
ncbi:hypothetical protein [Blastococcus sp. TF02A-35]|uniref:hypothetical protein n=1 Tax=Blastococcus sp. TF02A-35 TaxID=2559612 RepID=UPI0010744F14|nr:hypothetical protein [Blastococcus sp. TF02A_35]TFV51974.1 hypothetical protein E4P43_07950 [Blastococcus sp. TF02A_35]